MSKKRTSKLLARIMSYGSAINTYPEFKYAKVRVVPDKTYPNMYRVRWRDGTTTDLLNFSRANDAIRESQKATC
jgi:hypothetical protein